LFLHLFRIGPLLERIPTLRGYTRSNFLWPVGVPAYLHEKLLGAAQRLFFLLAGIEVAWRSQINHRHMVAALLHRTAREMGNRNRKFAELL